MPPTKKQRSTGTKTDSVPHASKSVFLYDVNGIWYFVGTDGQVYDPTDVIRKIVDPRVIGTFDLTTRCLQLSLDTGPDPKIAETESGFTGTAIDPESTVTQSN